MTISLIKPVKNEEVNACITELRKLLLEAEEGKIISIYGIAFVGNGQYKCIGTVCLDRHTAAGILLEASIERLNSKELL